MYLPDVLDNVYRSLMSCYILCVMVWEIDVIVCYHMPSCHTCIVTHLTIVSKMLSVFTLLSKGVYYHCVNDAFSVYVIL